MKLGIHVIPEFHVSQHQNRIEVLVEIKRVFGCGYIKPNNPRNPKDLTSVYVVRNLKDLRSKVIPFFKKYPFISVKQKDFEKFSYIVSLMSKKVHLKKNGMIAILKLAYSMNFNGKYRKQKMEDIITVLESSETIRRKPAFKRQD